MKKIRSLNLKTKIFFLGTALSLGFAGTFLLNNFLKDIYNSKKLILEEKFEEVLNKKVNLGEYSGIRFFGISVDNLKILDKKNLNSKIDAKNIYVGIMPFQSYLNQKWIFNIRPKKTEINVDRNFLIREKLPSNNGNTIKSKVNFDINLVLPKNSRLKFIDLGLEKRLKGILIYKSNKKQIIGNIRSKFEGGGSLKLKFNSNVNEDFFKMEAFSNGLNLKNTAYNIANKSFLVKKGNFKSNFKFYKSPTQTFCKGGFSFNKLILNSINFSEDIKSDSFTFFCNENNLVGKNNTLNYGTLTSDFNLNIPLNKYVNNVILSGSIGYLNSLNPDIKFSGMIPYWIDKRGLNLGHLDSNFDLNRTQLSNLNFFLNNGIRGFVTAKGKLEGKINDPKFSINFNIDYPHYKGVRIREIWEGEIKNENKKFFLNMKNTYSPIPSFLSIKFDSLNNLESINFSRIFNTNKGTLKIVKNNDSFVWNANNFPLDELEFSISNNKFNRISGIINGEGSTSSDQSFWDGRLAWSSGKYRNIKLTNSLFDFSFKDNNIYLNSSLYPIDGGMIEAEYDSSRKNVLNLNFNNISTSWTIITAIDIFNFDENKSLPSGNSKDLNEFQISNDGMSFNERIKYINNFLEKDSVLEDKFNLKKYLSKFESRYDAKLSLNGENLKNYKLNTQINGYFQESNNDNENYKDEFSLKLQGGFLKGKGSLEINKLPLKVLNIFLDDPKDFKGGLDINLFYDIDTKSFLGNINSNNASFNNNQIKFDKGIVNFNNSIFDIDFSLILDDSIVPINFEGLIPLNSNDNLDLRLNGNGRFIKLIDIFAEDYFEFKKGDVNIKMIIKGKLNKPILNGFIVIKDSEVELYNNILSNFNSLIIFDFDYLNIKNLTASVGEDGDLFMKGSLPFYSKRNSEENVLNLNTSKFNLKTNNVDFLVDSDLDITGSFQNPFISGNIALNDGFINFYSDKKINENVKEKEEKKNWPELNWDINKKIEIISNETILDSVLLGKTLPDYLENLAFKNLKLKLGPEFTLQYSEIIKANLNTKLDLNINGVVGKDLNARGLIFLEKGRANLYTTPFKLDKNKDNYILFASRSGVVPYINFSLTSKVPDSIIPINENNTDKNISGDLNVDSNSKGFNSFGIGNTRLIKIEASYEGFLDQLSFEDENERIQLRSTPSYNRSQIIGLIGGNSANLINRAFISQLNSAEAFSDRFQLSLYPAFVENKDSSNNLFVNENLNTENDDESTSNSESASQAWVAQFGLDITDTLNFAVQTIPGRDDLPPLGIFTFQANPNLELLGTFDSDGDWKSQFQLFFRY